MNKMRFDNQNYLNLRKYSQAVTLYTILSYTTYLFTIEWLTELNKAFYSTHTSMSVTLFLSLAVFFITKIYKYSNLELGICTENWKQYSAQAIKYSVIVIVLFIIIKTISKKLCITCNLLNDFAWVTEEFCSNCKVKNIFDFKAGIDLSNSIVTEHFTFKHYLIDILIYAIGVFFQEYIRSFAQVSLKNIFPENWVIPIFGAAFTSSVFHFHLGFYICTIVLIPHLLWSYLQYKQKSIVGAIISHQVLGITVVYIIGVDIF